MSPMPVPPPVTMAILPEISNRVELARESILCCSSKPGRDGFGAHSTLHASLVQCSNSSPPNLTSSHFYISNLSTYVLINASEAALNPKKRAILENFKKLMVTASQYALAASCTLQRTKRAIRKKRKWNSKEKTSIGRRKKEFNFLGSCFETPVLSVRFYMYRY